MRRMKASVVLLCMGVLGIALSSPGLVSALTLNPAVEKGLQNNHLLKAATMETLAQKEEYLEQKGTLFPSLWFYEEATRSNNPPFVWMTKMSRHDVDQSMMNMKGFNEPPETTNYESKFSFRYPLFHGGSLLQATRAKEALWKAKEGELRLRRQEVAYRVVRAYAGLLLAEAEEEAARVAVETARRHVEQAENRHRAGTALRSDVLQAKVFLAKMKDRLAKASKNRKVAALKLQLEMGCGMKGETPSASEGLETLYKRWYHHQRDRFRRLCAT